MTICKKKVALQAFRFGYDLAPSWYKYAACHGTVILCDDGDDEKQFYVLIANDRSMEDEIAKFGDYIIRDKHGEIYPCKPDVFDKKYYIMK